MDLDDWPDCPVPGCTNKTCLALNSDKCFVHTDGNEHVKRWKIDARNASPPIDDGYEAYLTMLEGRWGLAPGSLTR